MNRFFAAGALVILGLASESRAQGVVVNSGAWAGGSVPVAGTTYESTYVPPYSYYAAFPNQARRYVGLNSATSAGSSYGGCSSCGASHGSSGGGDFPFYGQPYGHVYDKYTWNYMAERTGSRFNPW